MIPGGETGEESGTGRSTGGGCGIGASEAGTFVSDAVDVGSMDREVAIGAGTVAAVLVVHKEEDVRAAGLAGLSLEEGGSESGLKGGAACKLAHRNEDILNFLYN